MIRVYEEEDCPAIIELFYNTVHYINRKDYSQEEVDVWAPVDIDESIWNLSLLENHSVVLDQGSDILGFGDMSRSGYLDRLYIHKDCQGRGLGRDLVSYFESYARDQAIDRIVTDASITARPFFEKLGYQVIGQQEVKRKGQVLVNYKMEKILR